MNGTTSDPSAADPFSILAESGNSLLGLAVLVPLAVVVLWIGSRGVTKAWGRGAFRPRGRPLASQPQAREKGWRAIVKRLDTSDPTPIAQATAGPVRLRGVLVAASENLGGPEGRECVWINRYGAAPTSAVGTDFVVMRDETGGCAIEGIERAHVIAPAEKRTLHHENVALYLGDHVEVYGHFTPEPTDDEENPSAPVYGTLTRSNGLDVRLLKRPQQRAGRPASSTAQT